MEFHDFSSSFFHLGFTGLDLGLCLDLGFLKMDCRFSEGGLLGLCRYSY